MKISSTPCFLILGLLLILSACNGVGTAEFDQDAIGIDDTDETNDTDETDDEEVIITFSGLTSVSAKTDSTVTLHWNAHADALAYDVFNTISGSAVYVTTVFGQSTDQASLTALTPGASYKFLVRMKNAAGQNDSNTNDILVSMNPAPGIPTVALYSPSSSPAYSSTPTIRVSNVKSGDTIKLYSDAGCTQLVASGVATGTTIDLVSSVLPVGIYAMAATATNTATVASACSSTPVAYEKELCPDTYGDFIPVPGNATIGTSEFCVAKYEMKNPGSLGVAKSLASGNPWVSITFPNALFACQALGLKYDIISNAEWMTIAREIEAEADNWSGGVLNRGWSASAASDGINNTGVAPTTDATCLYNTAANTCGAAGLHKLKRTHKLTNGEEIWDLAGNVSEFVDWIAETPNTAITAGPKTCPNPGVWQELQTAITDCSGQTPDLGTPTPGISTVASSLDTTLNWTHNIGMTVVGAGGGTIRGGRWNAGAYAGIFSIHLGSSTATWGADYGFRCVYRP